MRTRIASAIFIAAGLLLGSCVKQSDQNPREVADSFLKALSQKNYTQAKSYATSRTDRVLEAMNSISHLAPAHASQQYEILDQTVQGNIARVRYRYGNNSNIETLTLVKHKDQWLVGASR